MPAGVEGTPGGLLMLGAAAMLPVGEERRRHRKAGGD